MEILSLFIVLFVSNSLPLWAQALQELRIAWMAPEKEYHGVSASSSVGALKLALQVIQNNANSADLKYTIKVKWFDSDCNMKSALAAAVDAKEKFFPDLFLGPPCSTAMKGVALLASHWNIAVFGWVSNNAEFQNKTIYDTLVRGMGPLNRLPSTIHYISTMYKWKRFAMLNDEREPYKAVADALKPTDNNYYLNSTHVLNEDMPVEKVEHILQQIKKYARILLFAVPFMSMRKYMLVAHKLGMTNGDYAFICINGDLYRYEVILNDIKSDKVWKRNDTNDEDARQAFESVFYIMTWAEAETQTNFDDYVKKYSMATKPEWDLPEPGPKPDAYAPYLYDSVMSWLDLVRINNMKPEGRSVFAKAIGYSNGGVTGSIVLDRNADRHHNFAILDMQEDGTFQESLVIMYEPLGFRAMPKRNVRWFNGQQGKEFAPLDVPKCGFDGELCKAVPLGSRDRDIIIGAVTGSSFVLVIAVIVNIVLRRYRRLKMWRSMLWQVRFEEIDFVTALLSGSVRTSFRTLAKRLSGNANKKTAPEVKSPDSSRYPPPTVANLILKVNGSPERSPIQLHKCGEHGTLFGSVAYVRGSLVSVKRMSKNSVNLTKKALHELNQLMELKHQNVCAFVGACVDPGRILLLWEYCPKGSLQDVICNQNIKLDKMFMFALAQDVTKGLEFIHRGSIHYHGNLKSSNCVVDSRWTCKLTDFGVPTIRSMDKVSMCAPVEENGEKYFWSAPEVLRAEKEVDMQKADIYSLGVIYKEVFTLTEPYKEYDFLSPNEIIARVRDHSPRKRPLRPMITSQLRLYPELVTLVDECWNEEPILRPSASRAVKVINKNNPSKNLTMIDNMINILETYANHLEDLVNERTSELDAEKQKTENLLYRMLPQSVAEELKAGKPVKAEQFDEATIYFSDIVGFTNICATSTPIQVVNFLNSLYTMFDDIITRYDVYKVETIGDAYMLASGLPQRNGARHICEIADCALDIVASVMSFQIPHQPHDTLRIRVGIHSGPVVAGVVGMAMPRYCLFGDTVNTASRMESTGLALKIHLSTISKEMLEKYPGYHLQSRGEVQVKGKGIMKTYFLVGKDGFVKPLPKHDEDLCHHTGTAHHSTEIHRKLGTAQAPPLDTLPTLMSSRDSDLLIGAAANEIAKDFITQNTPDPDKDNISQSDRDSVSMISSVYGDEIYSNSGYDTIKRRISPMNPPCSSEPEPEMDIPVRQGQNVRAPACLDVVSKGWPQAICKDQSEDLVLTEEHVLNFLASKLLEHETALNDMHECHVSAPKDKHDRHVATSKVKHDCHGSGLKRKHEQNPTVQNTKLHRQAAAAGDRREKTKPSVVFTENSQTTML